jgi:hypothetical protein
MHTFKGESCRIHHNSDMSGDLHIIKSHTEEQIVIEAEDILKFVAEYIRSERVGEIESKDWREFVK